MSSVTGQDEGRSYASANESENGQDVVDTVEAITDVENSNNVANDNENDNDDPYQQQQQEEEEKRIKASSSKSLMSQSSASTSTSNSQPISTKSIGSTRSSTSSSSSSSKNKSSSSRNNNHRRGSSTTASDTNSQEINKDHKMNEVSHSHQDSSAPVPDSSKQEHEHPQSHPSAAATAEKVATAAGADTRIDKDEQVKSIKEKLEKSLQEEKMLLGLQMQLLTQVEQLDQSIAQVEGEERIARLAYQQANVTRLLEECNATHGTDGGKQDGQHHHHNNKNDKEILRISV